MSNVPLTQGKLIRMAATRLLVSIVLLSAMLFLPAGSLNYWEAWLYLVVVFVPVFMVFIYLLINDPALLERRLRMREKVAEQKIIIRLGYLYFLLAFVVPGFDFRFDWSQVPAAFVILADVLVMLGYALFFLVLRENSYASRIIEVEQGQKVINTGPYAMVRHPMYLGVMLMYIFSPLALGSYWALLPALLIIPLLVARIRNEENVLVRELNGYTEYLQKIKYRLVPGIW